MTANVMPASEAHSPRLSECRTLLNRPTGALVVGVGAVTGHAGSSALTFAAAALAAVVLQPVRARAGLVADRLVYGRRASPYEVLSEFAGRIAGTYSSEEVLPAMARMVAEATGAQRAEVWLRSGGAERIEAAWPAAGEPAPAAHPAEPDGRIRVAIHPGLFGQPPIPRCDLADLGPKEFGELCELYQTGRGGLRLMFTAPDTTRSC